MGMTSCERSDCLRLRGFSFDSVRSHSWVMSESQFLNELKGESRRGLGPVAGIWLGISKFKEQIAYPKADLHTALAITLYASIEVDRASQQPKEVTNFLSSFHAYRLKSSQEVGNKIPKDKTSWNERIESMKDSVDDDERSIKGRLEEAAGSADLNTSLWEARRSCTKRRFLITRKGYFGMGPEALRLDDILCILYGDHVPYVLRKGTDGQYTFIGKCYIHGLKQGEAFSYRLWRSSGTVV
jgi:hypothetical protein